MVTYVICSERMFIELFNKYATHCAPPCMGRLELNITEQHGEDIFEVKCNVCQTIVENLVPNKLDGLTTT